MTSLFGTTASPTLLSAIEAQSSRQSSGHCCATSHDRSITLYTGEAWPSIREEHNSPHGSRMTQDSSLWPSWLISQENQHRLHAFQVELELSPTRFLRSDTFTVDYTLSGARVLEGRQLANDTTQQGLASSLLSSPTSTSTSTSLFSQIKHLPRPRW